jgi:hypothetical protein
MWTSHPRASFFKFYHPGSTQRRPSGAEKQGLDTSYTGASYDAYSSFQGCPSSERLKERASKYSWRRKGSEITYRIDYLFKDYNMI